jgi:peptidyl-prolyl cis-trans isomerase C
MIRSLKYYLTLAAIVLAVPQLQPSATAASPGATDDSVADPVVATGKGFEIKRSQLDDAFVSYNTSIAANGGSIPEDDRSIVRSNLLQHLILTKILTGKATPEDKTITKKMIDENIEEARKSAPSPEVFDAQIKASGMTLDEVRRRAYEEQLARRVMERETTNGITISDATAKKFYDDNPDKFEIPEQVRVSHILISTLEPQDPLNPRAQQIPLPPDQKKQKEKLAREIKALADKGGDFEKLVKQYSEDTASKDKGGEYVFPRKKMVPEFEAAAFSLKVNQISDIVETQYGYHIIKLLEKLPAKHESFADAEPRIKAYLLDKEVVKTIPAYLDKLKTDNNVAVLDPNTGKMAPASK